MSLTSSLRERKIGMCAVLQSELLLSGDTRPDDISASTEPDCMQRCEGTPDRSFFWFPFRQKRRSPGPHAYTHTETQTPGR